MKTRFKAEKTLAHKGFTLIELAVVIAIIAILAAVAVPRFANLTQGAERAVAENYNNVLNTASATYTAQQAAVPTAYSDFIGAAATPTGNQTAVLLRDRNGNSLCGGAVGATLTCTWPSGGKAVYTFNGGSSTMAWTAGAAAAA